MVPELGHLLLQRHQGPADLFDLVVGERPVIYSPQGLSLHQLAQQLHDGENKADQAPLDRLRVGVNAMAPYGRALFRRCQRAHRPGTSSSSTSSLAPRARALAEVTSARSETRTMSTSAMASVTSPLTTTPPASTRSSRSTRAIRSAWMVGRRDWPGGVTDVGTSTGSSSCCELT